MAKDEIATLKLLQKGTDLIISTFDFTGVKLNDFDSPNGSNGYEAFSITSTHKGDYFFFTDLTGFAAGAFLGDFAGDFAGEVVVFSALVVNFASHSSISRSDVNSSG